MSWRESLLVVYVVGQRECFLVDRLTDLTGWSAGRAISVVGGAFASEWNQSGIKLRVICVICVVWQKERKSGHLVSSMCGNLGTDEWYGRRARERAREQRATGVWVWARKGKKYVRYQRKERELDGGWVDEGGNSQAPGWAGLGPKEVGRFCKLTSRVDGRVMGGGQVRYPGRYCGTSLDD